MPAARWGVAVGGGGAHAGSQSIHVQLVHRQHRLSTQVLRLDRPRVYSRPSICCIFRPFSEAKTVRYFRDKNFSTTSPSFWGPNQSVARFSTRPQNFRRLHFTASSCCVRCIDTGGPLVPSAVPQVVAGAAFGWARPPPHGMPSPTRDEEPTNLFALWTPRSTHIRTHKGQGGLYFLPSRSKFPFSPQILSDYHAPPRPPSLKKPPPVRAAPPTVDETSVSVKP